MLGLWQGNDSWLSGHVAAEDLDRIVSLRFAAEMLRSSSAIDVSGRRGIEIPIIRQAIRP